MGTFRGTSGDIEKIISLLRPRFSGTDYHIFNRNCNSFADEFLQQLLGVPAPAFVNRMAFYGSFFSCFLPENMNQDPTQQPQGAGGGQPGGSHSGGSSGSGSGSVYRTGGGRQASTSQPTKTFSGVAGVKLGGGTGASTSAGDTDAVGLVVSNIDGCLPACPRLTTCFVDVAMRPGSAGADATGGTEPPARLRDGCGADVGFVGW
jgi:hypothetical protein